MKLRRYAMVTANVFILIGMLHLVRAVLNIPIMVHTWQIPRWISYAIALIALALAFLGFKVEESKELRFED